jgi:hypothetical protein
MIPSVDSLGGKNPLIMQGWPGLRLWCKPGPTAEVRAFDIWDGYKYAIIGEGVYKILLTDHSATKIGTISSSAGDAWIGHNANGQMLIVAGGVGYIYIRSTSVFSLASSLDANFPANVNSVAFLDNYAIVTQSGTAGRLWYSGVNDLTSWVATDYVTAERNPDDGLCLIADHGELIVGGAKSFEFFYDSGELEATFRRRTEAYQEVGIGSGKSIVAIDNSIYFLDDQKNVRLMQGYNTAIISTDAIANEISGLSETSDAKGMAFILGGKVLYILTFPKANRTFAYNQTDSTKAQKHLWFELQSYPVKTANKWRGNCAIQNGSTIYIGDFENGNIYTLETSEYQDNSQPLKWVCTTQAVYDTKNEKMIFHDEVILTGESGYQDVPTVIMRYSDNNGNTWSSELFETFGEIGEYDAEASWAMLGCAKSRVYEFSGTSNAKRSFRPPQIAVRLGTR